MEEKDEDIKYAVDELLMSDILLGLKSILNYRVEYSDNHLDMANEVIANSRECALDLLNKLNDKFKFFQEGN